MQIIFSLLAIIGLVVVFFVSSYLARLFITNFLMSLVGLLKLLTTAFIACSVGILVGGIFMSFWDKGTFPFFIIPGIIATIAVGAFFYNLGFTEDHGWITVVANLFLSIPLGILIAMGVGELLQKEYAPVPFWMYILDYGTSVILCSVFFLTYSGLNPLNIPVLLRKEPDSTQPSKEEIQNAQRKIRESKYEKKF